MKVADVEVEVVAGALMAVVGVVGDVPEDEAIGARLGEVPGPVGLGLPKRLLMLPAESLAPCRCRGLYGKLAMSPPAFVYESERECEGCVVGTEGSVVEVSAGALGRCSDELDAPSNGWVNVSLGCRGVFAARPNVNDENRPLFCFGSSAISTTVPDGTAAESEDRWSLSICD